jgi:hypothetical protein
MISCKYFSFSIPDAAENNRESKFLMVEQYYQHVPIELPAFCRFGIGNWRDARYRRRGQGNEADMWTGYFRLPLRYCCVNQWYHLIKFRLPIWYLGYCARHQRYSSSDLTRFVMCAGSSVLCRVVGAIIARPEKSFSRERLRLPQFTVHAADSRQGHDY